jgi:hypothetical protein
MAMANDREIVLLGPATVTTSGVGPDINLPQGFTSAIITAVVQTVSGTLPTLNIYVQNKLPQAAATDTSGLLPTGTAIYDDLISFAQSTTSTTTQVCRIVGGGNTVNAQSDAALAAGTVRNGPIGGTWRIKYVVSGTTPSIALNVVSEMIP